MADIFELLNKLNVSPQGTQITLVDCKRKVDMAMVWKDELKEGNWQLFAFLQSLAENLPQHPTTFHLEYLVDNINDRYTVLLLTL